ncbi:MAG: MarR family transcriptional regulator [Dehalococcoidia bacterium]
MQTIDTDLKTQAFKLFGRLFAQSDPSRLDDWARLGLTMSQVRVLAILEEEQGLPAGDLAERLGVQPSTVTRIVDRLVHHQLVRREADEEDRRLVRHYVTDTGVDALNQMRSAGRRRFDDFFNRLTEAQLERVVAALKDLTETFDAVESKEHP